MKTPMYGYDGNGFTIGDRVELHPGCTMWMRGARFGEVIGFPGVRPTRRIIEVKLDKAGIIRLDMARVRRIEA